MKTLHKVAVVNFGSISTNGICNILMKLNIDYQIVLPDETISFNPTHIILSGGSKHVYNKDHYSIPKWVLDANVPVLGICYGMQLIAYTFGGVVRKMTKKEEGPAEITEIIDNNQVSSIRWMNREDQVLSVNNHFSITGVTNKNHIASFTDYDKWWAIQYHPESKKYRDLNVFRRFLNTSVKS